MKIVEKLTGTAKNNKKKMVVGGAVLFIGCAAAFLYLSGQGRGLFKNLTQGGVQESIPASNIKRPDRDPDIMGIVESVNGNEIKILKLDASSMPGMNKDGRNASTNNSGQNVDRNNMQPPTDMAQGQSGSTSGKNARNQMITELKKKSTGEEVVIVPVGIQMSKMGGGQPNGGSRPTGNGNNNDNTKPSDSNTGNRPQGGGEVEATISDITADKMVMIWLDSDVAEKKVAEFVSIMR